MACCLCFFLSGQSACSALKRLQCMPLPCPVSVLSTASLYAAPSSRRSLQCMLPLCHRCNAAPSTLTPYSSILSPSHARGLLHGLCWRRACGRQTRDNDRSSSVRSMTGSSSSRSVAFRRRYLSGVCVGVRCQKYQKTCRIRRDGSSCGICRGGSSCPAYLAWSLYWFMLVSVLIGMHASRQESTPCTPLDKRARNARLLTRKHGATPGAKMRCKLCVCSLPESTLHVCQEVCLSVRVSATSVCRDSSLHAHPECQRPHGSTG